jgi:hypothetical protein
MLKASAVALGLALAAAIPANAQNSCTGTASCTASVSATLDIPALVSLQVGSSGSFALTAPAVTDITTNGYVQDAGPAITVKANRSWTLSVSTTNVTNWNYSGTQGGVKPIGDLTWSTTSGGTYNAISGTPAVLATGAKTNAGAPTIFFRTLYPNDFGDNRNAVGTYDINLTFTLTAP